ncbi:MAG: drug resistance transporter, EmrB/QacA subfamily [Actinomycetia bacterium]|nr:drug resistance transporter, EmrB/QacA subfamily [Actinomycetes bacterium]
MYATYERRWWTLAILCLSLVLIVLGNTVLNVALPTLQREIGATATQLQWMVDAYSLVFAGLLLTAGALGDRFGRKGFLSLGLTIFGLAALGATQATEPWHLIAARAAMGIGAAFVMPATLSILTNVFPPHERAKAIGIWAGLAGAGAAIGPVAGGLLLQHFSWSSVFYLNIPVVVVGLVGGALLVPTSKDPDGHPLDPVGAVLSIAGLTALIYAVIEGPNHGWLGSETLLTFGLAIVLLGGFGVWELRSANPMLDLKFFRNPRFSAASGAIMVQFMTMMGMFFVLTQYLQFGRAYSALSAGVHSLPMPIAMMTFATLSPKFVERFGPRKIVTVGMSTTGLAFVGLSMLDISSSYALLAVFLFFIGAGAGLVMPPSTTSIMSTLPLGKAGVGSAVNDTTREIGAALGVGIMGSVLASGYQSSLKSTIAALPAAAREQANTGFGEALQIAQRLGGSAGARLADAARVSFIDGMQVSLWVAAGLLFVGALAVNRSFPSHAQPHPTPTFIPEEADVDGPEALEPVEV